MQHERFAFFDFCETLADFQTADAFVDFVRSQTQSKRMRCMERVRVVLVKLRVVKLLSILSRGRHSVNKMIKLRQLTGLPAKSLEQMGERYYQERVRPHLINEVIVELLQRKKEGYCVGLVSGGYDVYLRFFVEEYGLDFCYSSHIGVRDGVCTGRLDGIDCMRQNKVQILDRHFPVRPVQSVAYSDSITDLPMLSWATTAIVVSCREKQLWAEKHGFKQLIWGVNPPNE